MLVNFGVITTSISLIGVVANVLNIATFIKQGFKETIDISLTALATTDMASLICLLWMSMSYNPSFCDLICDVIDLIHVEYLTAGLPRAYFSILSGCITSIVAFERCLCVVKPLQVKVLFTKTRLSIALPCVSLGVMCPFIPLYYTAGFGWVFNPETNRTVLSLTYRDNRNEIDFICFSIMLAMCIATYIAVFISTFIIVLKLATQRAWRIEKTNATVHSTFSTNTKNKSDQKDVLPPTTPAKSGATSLNQQKSAVNKKTTHGRDKRATQTVTFIAAMYIICFFPGAVLQLVMSCVPDFNKGMKYSQHFDICWSFANISEAVCASANIAVYLKTSSRFKKTFLGLFRLSTAK